MVGSKHRLAPSAPIPTRLDAEGVLRGCLDLGPGSVKLGAPCFVERYT